ncbi:hypothetical protein IPG41_02335 [Candidatus Peregrinibacteria bacterium]|nr:MAG: hypothetical protein IPG41_02335 [Candidatus Peregrinibacteria bacterium]
MSFEPSKSDPSKSSTPDPLLPIWEAIWERTPILKEIMEKHGNRSSLYEYTRGFLDINPMPALDERRKEFISIVEDLLKQRLNPTVAQEVAAQLAKYHVLSTTDHHGPITHPYWINSNIISVLPYHELTDPVLKYMMVLSFASVSLNNPSAYPRGIVFHGNNRGSEDFIRLPVLPDKEKMSVVYNARAFNKEDVFRAKEALARKVQEGLVLTKKAEGVKGLLDHFFLDEQVLAAPDLSTQITIINYKLWPELFKKEGTAVPNLIYLDIETVMTELLVKFHLNKPDSLLYKLLFDKKYQELARQYFNGIPGAFDLQKDLGTYFFWGLDSKNHRIRFVLQDGKLVCPDGEHQYDYTPEEITKALQMKKIFPSMMLCYVMAACYYGYKCLGGFSQVSDLTQTKQAWMRLLKEVDEEAEARAIEPLQTKEMSGGGTVVSFLETQSGDLLPATGIDMAVYDDKFALDEFIQLSRQVTFYEMMNPMVVDIYKVLYTEVERDPEFLKWTPEAIMDYLDLKKRIPSGEM